MPPYFCQVTLIYRLHTRLFLSENALVVTNGIKLNMEVYVIQTCGVILNHIEQSPA